MTGVTTVFLRFPDEASAQAMLASFGAAPPEGQGFSSFGTGAYQGHRYDYVVVNLAGAIFKPTGQTIETEYGSEPELVQVPGYHVNLRWEGPPEAVPDFGPIRVYPLTPECVFVGE